jgi:hypothetical protein
MGSGSPKKITWVLEEEGFEISSGSAADLENNVSELLTVSKQSIHCTLHKDLNMLSRTLPRASSQSQDEGEGEVCQCLQALNF